MAKIINRVDVNYFRSVYSATLNKCEDINIITGGNDAGKSNILKALNLFFNGFTEPHSTFEFSRDLNRDRETEARAAKGRMSIWIKVHFNNFLKWDSLPEQFSIKRSWNRYETRATDTISEDIPATTIGRFLNKVKYNYIPAIRGRDIFSDLLAEMHDTLLQDESLGLRNSSDALVSDLHKLTNDMTVEILNKLKIDSTISIPESLRDLFRALDFSTKFGTHNIPLVLRGDGIQSRHLPFILDYIAQKSKQHHIWGYEEPENSLELSKAFEMASDFSLRFSQENQIFLTTHSPAFYDISGPNSARWIVESRSDGEKNASFVSPITGTTEVDKTMGLLAVITPRMKAVYDDFSTLKSSVHGMQKKLDAAECPLIYVEGPTDVTILERARQALGFGHVPMKFESSGGAGDLTEFLKVNARLKHNEIPLIGLFDADARGRREFDRFKLYHVLANTSLRTINRNTRIFVGALQIPEHLHPANTAFHAIGMPLPLPIEFMFPSAVIRSAIDAGELALVPRISRIANDELPLEVNVDNIIAGRIDEEFTYLAKAISSEHKTRFSNWVVTLDDATFEPFRPILNSISTALQN